MKYVKQQNVTVFNNKWLCSIYIALTLMNIMWGCAIAPKKLVIKDTSKSFNVDTIVSTKSGAPVSFKELMDDLSGVQVIYIGEKHTDPAHHNIQLNIIKDLFTKHPKLVVGMEAFAYPYQEQLDMWSAGKLDQKAFLEKTHWYANWKFDYGLYGDILEFLKDKKIRLVGLNIPFHIPPKISVGGIENLSDDEKKYLPKQLNTSNPDHRAYVEDIFKNHHIRGRENFEYFYMAQCVWEDTMAESITNNLKGNIMVVLVGNGHIIRKFGIPDRAYNLTKASFKTVFLSSAGSEAELSNGDYIWVTPANKKRTMRKLSKSGANRHMTHKQDKNKDKSSALSNELSPQTREHIKK